MGDNATREDERRLVGWLARQERLSGLIRAASGLLVVVGLLGLAGAAVDGSGEGTVRLWQGLFCLAFGAKLYQENGRAVRLHRLVRRLSGGDPDDGAQGSGMLVK